jgi:hypothetical protein
MQHNSAKLILREGELRPPSNFVFPAELDWDDHASPGAESDSELLYGVDAHKILLRPHPALSLMCAKISICRIEILNCTFDPNSL